MKSMLKFINAKNTMQALQHQARFLGQFPLMSFERAPVRDLNGLEALVARSRRFGKALDKAIVKPVEVSQVTPHDVFVERYKLIKHSHPSTFQAGLIGLMVDMVSHYAGGKVDSERYISSQSWWRPLLWTAKTCGFVFLGNGFFSGAYKHELMPERVLKVGFKKEDSGAAYAAFCRQHQGLPGIPIIHDIQRHQCCYTVVLDELKKYPEGAAARPLKNQYDIVKYTLLKNEQHFHAKPQVESDYDKALTETCELIYQFFKGVAEFDLHDENVMVCPSTGKVIITDPVSFSQNRGAVTFDAEPEALLEMVKDLREKQHVARWVKRNKAHRDRFIVRKEARRDRRVAERHRKVRKVQAAGFRLQDINRRVVGHRIDLVADSAHLLNIWRVHTVREARAIEQEHHERFMVNDMFAINGHGQLMIDKALDARFLG